MPPGLRRVLHCAVDQQPGQTRGAALLLGINIAAPVASPGDRLLFRAAAFAGDVRHNNDQAALADRPGPSPDSKLV
jgi:hypothetical protein